MKYLTETEQRQLLAEAKRVADPLAQRDYHWMAALILTGMRIQEFSRLTAEQVRLALRSGYLVSLKQACKGKRRTNEYLVTNNLQKHLQALLGLSDEQAAAVELAPGAMQPLVWGRDVAGRAGALSVRSYEARMKLWVDAAHLDPRASPHWLRHTRAMNILRRTRGKNGLNVAQRALNHVSLRSTGVYTAMCREEYERELHLVDGGRVPRRVAREMTERLVA